jgi:hypothetical protein
LSFDKPNQWLTFIANVGVLLGIALVAYELHQNSQATIGDTQQNLLNMLHERDDWLLDQNFAATVVKAENEEELSSLEQRQYAEWVYGKFNICEHVFDRYKAGLMSSETWQGWDGGCRSFMEVQASRDVWSDRKSWYAPEFVSYYDEVGAAAASKHPPLPG